MKWIEDNYDGEMWSFNSSVDRATASSMTQADNLQPSRPGDMIQILANRLMEGKISVALKKLGLGSFTVCDVHGDPGPEFEAIKKQGSGRSIMFMLKVNQNEQLTLKQKMKQISDDDFPVMMFSAKEQLVVPNGRG
ncbi:hypothetical protein [Thiomicrorhabdus xiamenensis]|uniref:Uncharacterized protein n=1 Tax=Thiomicrorhabdus xiamenensis TaxID=2739063 RepID=A0A7D4NSI3_9GAMM|nr:hypothetical protein [Thiomicrorhabdus xiamenensis]QKI89997.1 hypothetical protein HQN79_10645 [Thiomicrorhabdus xiamenensis]